MRYAVKIEEIDSGLSNADLELLSTILPRECLCTTEILNKLHRIVVADFGPTEWHGLWEIIIEIADGQEAFKGAQILLNTFYAGFGSERIVNLVDSLCHEYGHHWTMCWAIEYVEQPLRKRYLLPFYKARNISRNILHYDIGYTSYYDWLYCDKEVVAEDFKYFFTPCKKHAMEYVSEIGLPNIRLQYFLSRMVHPDHV